MGNGIFQTTHWSVVLDAGAKDSGASAEALNQLCRTYWRPLYVFLRQSGLTKEEAEDFTQGFLAALIRREGLSGVSREKGRFRSFLIASLKNYLSHEREKQSAKKRGGGMAHVSLQDPDVEAIYQREMIAGETPELAYERRWAQTVLGEAMRRLQGEYAAAGKSAHFEYLVDFLPGGQSPLSQAEIAEALGSTVSAVKSEVYRLRRRFGQFLRAEVADTVASPSEIDEEIRHLISIVGGARPGG